MRRVLAGFALSIVVFGAFLFVFDPTAMWAELEGVALLPFGAGLIAVLLAVACWAESMRRVLLAAGGSVPARRGFTAYAAGMFAKQVLPMGNAGGVPIMAYAIDREARIGFNRSLAVVTVGDFLGLLSTLALAMVGVVYVVLFFPATALLQAALVGVALFAAALLSVAALLLVRRRVLRYVVLGLAHLLRGTLGRLSRRVEATLAPGQVATSVDRYFETFDAVRGDRRSLAVAAGLSLLGWTLFAVPLYTSAVAVGDPLAFGLVLFVVPAGGLAAAIPLPGGIGGVEFAIAGMLVALTATDLAAVGALVLLYRVCVYWFPVLLGGLAVAYTGVNVRSLGASEADVPDLEARS